MPFSGVLELFKYWHENPPISETNQILVRALTNWEPQKATMDADDLRREVTKMGGVAHSVEALPEWMKLSLAAMTETVN